MNIQAVKINPGDYISSKDGQVLYRIAVGEDGAPILERVTEPLLEFRIVARLIEFPDRAEIVPAWRPLRAKWWEVPDEPAR